jgi:hypothetical protein
MNSSSRPGSIASRLGFAAALVFLVATGGCGKKETGGTPAPPSKPPLVSAEKTSFDEVTAQLDPSGSLYAYLSTSQWLDGLSGRINGWRDPVLSLPDLGPQERTNVNKAFDLVTRLIQGSGLESITGVGLSGIALEQGLYQTKFVVHRKAEGPTGCLWTLFGETPRPLYELDWLPAETAWAAFSDFDGVAAWSALRDMVNQSGFTEAKEGLDRLNGVVQAATGKTFDELFGSLGDQGGAFLTLHSANKVTIPIPNGTSLEIPEPGLAIILKVKDDALFSLIDGALQNNPQVIRSDADGLRMRVLPIPVPLPVTLRLTVARQGDHLFLASNDELVKNLLAVKAGKQPGLRTTAEFNRLAQGLPSEGNSFAFVSQRLGDTLQKVQASFLSQASASGNGAPMALLQKMFAVSEPVSSFAVGQSTGSGWLTVGHGTQQPANAVVLPLVVAPVAILAGVTLPALAQAKSKAQTIACVSNLKQMGLAARIYANDHDGVFPPDFLAMTNELVTPRILICPADPARSGNTVQTWADFNPAQSSYEYLGADLKESTPGFEAKVLVRCRIHGNECLGDGSAHMKDSSGRSN